MLCLSDPDADRQRKATMRGHVLTCRFYRRTSGKFGGWAAVQTLASVLMDYPICTKVPAVSRHRDMLADAAREECSD